MKKQYHYYQVRKCKYCGKEFNAPTSNIKQGKGNYCSKPCSNRGNNLGYKIGHASTHTKEGNLKISIANKGRIVSDVTRRRISQANTGKRLSVEHRHKLSIAHKGMKFTATHIENIKKHSNFQKGHKLNLGKSLPKKGIYKTCPECNGMFYIPQCESTRRKYCSRLCMNSSVEYRNGISERQKGGIRTEDMKKRISMKLREISPRGADSPLWQGGKSYEPYPSKWTRLLKMVVRERDNYICFICKQYGNYVHHIDYNKLNCDHSNLITLCLLCHIHTNKHRDYWIGYFREALCQI